ncbi:ABC transporter substrate-binding protein [Bacillus sp. V3B]|uniref:ABC transporter substrate-binding protein n=1 Tax=Bacillus sp. V3B TaxID=2804915 RepID=UPI00210D0B87|nr:ABC transporter substrate-binding protein [Bacillus sp. V3B]MCQ6276935.1 ABC transporter substrate-binding protein [Bacillus sp. V3B]
MKKFYLLLFSLLLLVGVLVGCGAADEKETSQSDQAAKTEQTNEVAFPITIKDAMDQDVVIEAKPEKIVSLISSNTEIAFALGLGDEIVGVSDHDTYPEEALEKEKIGGMEFNIEKIISLQPDLVLAHGSSMGGTSSEGLQQLRDSGITVLVVNAAKNFAEVYDSIEMIGTATGKKEESETIVNEMKSKVEEVKEKATLIKEEDKKKVYVELDIVPNIFGAGKNTFMDEMLSMIHAENVISEEGWQSIDQEVVIARNPDVIITTYGLYTEGAVEQLLKREGWQDINAVKNKQVIDVHPDKVSRPGPRLVEGVEEFAKAVYPDIFNQ